MEVIKEDGKLKVKSEYNAEFIRKAHELSGKWDSPYWVFDEKNEQIVRQTLMEVYGEDGTPQKEVTIDIDLDKYFPEYYRGRNDDAEFHGKSLCYRPGRDSNVKMRNDAIVIKGGFPSNGGSRNHPALDWENGTVIRVTVTEAAYLAEKEHEGITLHENDDKTQKIQALKDEKERLMARVAEIDAEMEKLNK